MHVCEDGDERYLVVFKIEGAKMNVEDSGEVVCEV